MEPISEPQSSSRWWTAALRLTAIALVVGLAVGLTAQVTRQRIARNDAAQVMKVLDNVLVPGSFDNQPHRDRIMVLSPELLGSDAPLPLYRARRQGEPTAVVVTAIARAGYVGPIQLLISLGADGKVIAVRAVAHQETPGLGDRIDVWRSDWITGFSGRSLTDPEPPGWAVSRDGGAFDQITGATITSRAVVNAVRDAQLYFAQHQEEIFQRPTE